MFRLTYIQTVHYVHKKWKYIYIIGKKIPCSYDTCDMYCQPGKYKHPLINFCLFFFLF